MDDRLELGSILGDRLELGSILEDRFRIEGIIGQGGRGKVYEVWDLRLEKSWAMKMVDQEEKEEGELLINLSHKGIPMIIDMFFLNESFCMVMEYIKGETLEAYVTRKGSLTERETMEKGIEIASILIYLHALRPTILYLDLKPDNIMIRETGDLVLLDFGASLIFLRESNHIGENKTFKMYGTKGYAPIEQMEYSQESIVDERSDIFALGILLYYMATGHSPNKPPYQLKDIRHIDSNHSKELATIIKKATNHKKQDRFSSAFIMTEKLKEAKKKGKSKYKRRLTILAYIVLVIMGFTAILWSIPLSVVIFGIAVLWKRLVLFKWRKKWLIQEKLNLVLTSKKTIGLIVLMLVLASTTSFAAIENKVTGQLFVEVIDKAGRNILIKEGSIYYTKEAISFKAAMRDYQISVDGGSWQNGNSGQYKMNIQKLKENYADEFAVISFRGKNEENKLWKSKIFYIAYGE